MKNHYIFLLLSGLIFASTSMASTSTPKLCPPTYRHTPYVGLSIGGINSYHNAQTSFPGSSINKFDMSEQSFTGELMAGWLFRLPARWQLGFETNYGIAPNESDALIYGNVGSGTKVKVNSDWAWSGGIRLGYMLSQVSTFYLRAGFEYRQFHTKLYPTINNVTAIDRTASKMAFTPAVGFEVNVAQRWAVGGEFRSARFGTINATSSDNLYKTSVKPRVDTYMVNLKYKFWTNDKK